MVTYPIYSGAGNTFVIVEGCFRKESIPDICDRFDTDGLLLLSGSAVGDVFVRFFNRDGSEAESCGNGLRCLARYCYSKWGKKEVVMESGFGIYHALYLGSDYISVNMTKPSWDLQRDIVVDLGEDLFVGHFINTGVPHFVIFVADVNDVDVNVLGSKIRNHEIFSPKGVNVDFISGVKNFGRELLVRTYERGVERETFACGTGALAGALFCNKIYGIGSPIDMKTYAGEVLEIIFDDKWEKILCNGPAVKIAEKSFENCCV
ncbi:MAG: diaminopimelate epimerase [Victivallaceae bacterium]